VISLTGVTKIFGKRAAVEDLALHVPQGEVFGLLGHNGAGKSTAIGMMLGQVWPSSGQILICGHDVTAARGRALAKVGAIFESPAFYDYLSGWRNLEILTSYTAHTPRERMKEILDWVGLAGREHSKVKTYSHGMRARLALAQALLPAPELLILDEPSDGLDPEGIHEMRQMILRMHRELGVTILLSSHLLPEVEQLCTRIAVLNRGRKVFEGTLAETKRRERCIRLATDNPARASELLGQAGLVTGKPAAPSPMQILDLADGRGPEEVVRVLVQNEISIYEISPVEQTLESFYLGLMRNGENKSSGS